MGEKFLQIIYDSDGLVFRTYEELLQLDIKRQKPQFLKMDKDSK